MQHSSWSHWHELPNYFKYSCKRKQASKQVSYYWISSKKRIHQTNEAAHHSTFSKKKHSSNEVVNISIYNWCNTFHDLTDTYCQLIKIFYINAALYKPSRPLLNFFQKDKMVQTKQFTCWSLIDATLSMISLTHIVNYYKYSKRRQQGSKQVGYHWFFFKKTT